MSHRLWQSSAAFTRRPRNRSFTGCASEAEMTRSPDPKPLPPAESFLVAQRDGAPGDSHGYRVRVHRAIGGGPSADTGTTKVWNTVAEGSSRSRRPARAPTKVRRPTRGCVQTGRMVGAWCLPAWALGWPTASSPGHFSTAPSGSNEAAIRPPVRTLTAV